MRNSNTKYGLAVLAMLTLPACQVIDAGGTLQENPAALSGDFSGKDASGAYTIILAPGDIPGVPASNGKRARWSQTEVEQVLYLDGDCQKQMYEQLPGWAQAVVKESGWQTLAVGIGQGVFTAIAYPGVAVARVILAGMGYGAVLGVNTARQRQDMGEKGAVAYCMVLNMYETKRRYPGTLEGINVVPWYGNGHVDIPAAKDERTAPTLAPVRNGGAPPPFIR